MNFPQMPVGKCTSFAVAATIALSGLSCTEKADNDETKFPGLTEVWEAHHGLNKAECVIYDPIREVLYVSCGETYSKGTSGYLSKLALNGEVIDARWLDSLQRPTGMALKSDTLYVADIDRLVAIDIENRQVARICHTAHNNPGLNDVAVSSDGQVYITASFSHALYALNATDTLQLVMEDTVNLRWANGILAVPDHLLIGGDKLIRYHSEKGVTSVNARISDVDGLTSVDDSGYFLTTVDSSALYFLTGDDRIHKVRSDEGYWSDLIYVTSHEMLYVARGDHQKGVSYVAAFKLD